MPTEKKEFGIERCSKFLELSSALSAVFSREVLPKLEHEMFVVCDSTIKTEEPHNVLRNFRYLSMQNEQTEVLDFLRLRFICGSIMYDQKDKRKVNKFKKKSCRLISILKFSLELRLTPLPSIGGLLSTSSTRACVCVMSRRRLIVLGGLSWLGSFQE
jgi:hypothetical protein